MRAQLLLACVCAALAADSAPEPSPDPSPEPSGGEPSPKPATREATADEKTAWIDMARAGDSRGVKRLHATLHAAGVDYRSIKDRSKQTALHAAAFGGTRGAGARPIAATTRTARSTHLLLCCMAGDAETVSFLCADLGMPSLPADYDIWPLHQAARHGHIAAMQVLIRCGADPSVDNAFDHTPASWARMNKHEAFAQELEALAAIRGKFKSAGNSAEQKKEEEGSSQNKEASAPTPDKGATEKQAAKEADLEAGVGPGGTIIEGRASSPPGAPGGGPNKDEV